MRLAIALLIALPGWAALVDPGAGLKTPDARRTARVAAWQAAWANMGLNAKQAQARMGFQDLYEPRCLYEIVKRKTKDSTISPRDAELWVESTLAVLLRDKTIAMLDSRCDAPRDWTAEPAEQGGTVRRVLVISGRAYADGIRRRMPILPRVGSVAPMVWGTMSESTCTFTGSEADRGPCYASEHEWSEAHLHLVEAIVLAEGAIARFRLVASLDDVAWGGPVEEVEAPLVNVVTPLVRQSQDMQGPAEEAP